MDIHRIPPIDYDSTHSGPKAGIRVVLVFSLTSPSVTAMVSAAAAALLHHFQHVEGRSVLTGAAREGEYQLLTVSLPLMLGCAAQAIFGGIVMERVAGGKWPQWALLLLPWCALNVCAIFVWCYALSCAAFP
jgi:hypothetical protein